MNCLACSHKLTFKPAICTKMPRIPHAADHDVQKSVSNARKHFAQQCPCQILLTQTAEKPLASAQMPSYVNGLILKN